MVLCEQANSMGYLVMSAASESVDRVIAGLGLTREQWDRKTRARMFVMNLILKKQAERQRVTDEMLNRRCTI